MKDWLKNIFQLKNELFWRAAAERLAEKYVPDEKQTVSTGSTWLLFEKIKENVFH